MELYLTFHKVLDKLQQYQEQNPALNSFGYGNLVDFGKNVSGQTVQYPLLFIVPQSVQYDENTTTYQLTAIVADRLNETLDNEKDAVSDCSIIARNLVSVIKRGFLQDYFETILPANALPFIERFNDNVAGVALDLNLIVYEDVNACIDYPSATPSTTPTSTPGLVTATPTPTNTGTPTPTPTLTETPTNTPTTTSTPTPSITPSPTMTETPSSTPTNTPTTTPTSTPTPTPSGAAAFSPADLTNLYDWWRADTGIQFSAGTADRVTGWTGYNGIVLTASTLDNDIPQYNTTDALFNNEPSIRFNPNNANINNNGMRTLNSTSATSKCAFIVFYQETIASNEDIFYYGMPSFGQTVTIFGNTATNYYIYAEGGAFQPVTGNTFTSNSYQVIRMQTDYSAITYSWFASNTSDFSNLIATNSQQSAQYYNTDFFGIMDWQGFYGQTPRARVVEVIYMNAIPTNTEITNLNNYINTRYGI